MRTTDDVSGMYCLFQRDVREECYLETLSIYKDFDETRNKVFESPTGERVIRNEQVVGMIPNCITPKRIQEGLQTFSSFRISEDIIRDDPEEEQSYDEIY